MCKDLTPAVTVIVPVYKVSAYIEKCARSLFEQTLDDLEILFVDDCSPDNSLEIIKAVLEEYPNRKSQTRIIKMPSNSGLAAVRREGIIEAKGDYIIHCDGDDWVDPNLYELMYNEVRGQGADVACCDFIYEEKDGPRLIKTGEIPDSGKNLLVEWYSNSIHMSGCNKMIKKEILIENDVLPWIDLNMWEDNALMLRAFYYVDKIVKVDNLYYHYNKLNYNAMSASYGEKQINQMIEIARRVTEFYDAKPDREKFLKTVKALQFYARINLVSDSFKQLHDYKNTFPDCVDVIPHISDSAFSKRGRIRFKFVKYHLEWLFVALFKVKKFFSI